MPQTETGLKQAASRLIDELLATALNASPGASGVELAVIDDRSDLALPRYSILNSIAQRRTASTSMPRDQPLRDWTAFLPLLRSGRSHLVDVGDLQASPLRDHFRSSGVHGALVCPVIGPRPVLAEAVLAGAVFTTWAGEEPPASDEALAATIAVNVRVAGQIAAVLGLCEQACSCVVSSHPAGQDACLV